jgi:hypothetical protein
MQFTEYDSRFVRPLCEVENEFLQVLVTEFSLKPKGGGLELSVSFGPDSQAIWRRKAGKANLGIEELRNSENSIHPQW